MIPINWEIFRYIGSEPIPAHLKKWWFALGGTVMYLFIIQFVTGIMLTFYYVPSPDHAYESIVTITQDIRFGWYIRSLHKWASHFLIVAMILHVLRVFFTGSYRHPRQLNWMVGFSLLIVMLMFGLTGYSLVYEQLSFWGATVATNLVSEMPIIGGWASHLLRGGDEVGSNTLTRFYIFHIGILPTIAILLLALHIVFIRLHGVKEEESVTEKKYFKFWPDHVTTEMMIGAFLMYILTIFSLIFPAGLGEPANPNVTPAHIKPEWYFYFSYRLLKLTSLKLSVIITMAMGGIAFFWPFIESFLHKYFSINRQLSMLLGTLAFMGFLSLTVWESLA
ncbi:MAG: cytochrome bc complex cytochrome b subunit [Candidatus Marinimicrobia bacterium]|nr:cytochrome bc complex cytochrome b subunit [Candidatus Neomarinimicrobiota bacterium]